MPNCEGVNVKINEVLLLGERNHSALGVVRDHRSNSSVEAILLGTRGVVGSSGNLEGENNEAGHEDSNFERGPLLAVKAGEHLVRAHVLGVLLIADLSQLEVETSDLIVGEVGG